MGRSLCLGLAIGKRLFCESNYYLSHIAWSIVKLNVGQHKNVFHITVSVWVSKRMGKGKRKAKQRETGREKGRENGVVKGMIKTVMIINF